MVLKIEPDIKPFFFNFRFNPGFYPVFDRLLIGFGSINRTGLAIGSRLNRPVRSGF